MVIKWLQKNKYYLKKNTQIIISFDRHQSPHVHNSIGFSFISKWWLLDKSLKLLTFSKNKCPSRVTIRPGLLKKCRSEVTIQSVEQFERLMEHNHLPKLILFFKTSLFREKIACSPFGIQLKQMQGLALSWQEIYSTILPFYCSIIYCIL